ncbi:hypothetical protein PIB30_085102, partial [Stylosanthes scabra]|nr:hypothetical protein [Stylosanthes scabra]
KTPSPTPSDFERQKTRGKAVASELRKRNTRGHSRGLSSNKALKIGESSHTPATTRVLRFRQIRTTFVNRESSPIDADEEIEADQETPTQALLTHAALEPTPPHESVVSQTHPESQDQDLDLLISQAKQVYSSGGKVPLGGGTSSKEAAELGAAKGVPSMSAKLSKIAAKIISFLGLPLEDLAANDKLKAELIGAIILADRKKDLDAIVDGWKLLCRRAVGCSEATSQIFQVLEQGKKSEQEAVAQIKALEDELAVVRAESDMGKGREAYNAAEKKVEAFDKLCAHLKLSHERFI